MLVAMVLLLPSENHWKLVMLMLVAKVLLLPSENH
ncbi:hypothetical protein OROMI_021189 [Orobanche minor]